MSEDAPPLKVWVFPIASVLLIVISFFVYTYSDFGPYARVVSRSNSALEAALADNVSDTSAVSVVILGSSLTEQALPDPKGIEDSISVITGKKAKVLRVALNYMNMEIANRIGFFTYMTRYPPRYLFIENYGLNLDNSDSSMIPVPVDAALLDIRNQVRKAIGLSTHDNYYSKWYTFDSKPPEGYFYTDGFDSATFKSLLTKRSIVRKPSQNGCANAAYAALMKGRTKVVFLDMPQSNKLVKNFLDEPAEMEFGKLLDHYRSQYRIEYWRYPHVMEDRFFYDGAHMNSKGAQQYMQWFVSQIASEN